MKNFPAEPVWYCVRTGIKQEPKVASLLGKEIGLDVLSLSVRFRRLRKGAPIWVKEALFPGYVFARFSYSTQHRHVRSISGVTGIVQFGDLPAEVPRTVIEEFQSLSPAGEVLEINPTLQPGSEVTISSGALRGVQALITRVLPAQQRVAILLEILGAPREVEIDAARVLPRHPRRSTALP